MWRRRCGCSSARQQECRSRSYAMNFFLRPNEIVPLSISVPRTCVEDVGLEERPATMRMGCRGLVALSDKLLWEIPRTQMPRGSFGNEYRGGRRCCYDCLVQELTGVGLLSPSEQSYANNSTGITLTTNKFEELLFVCMILPGGGCRLQTCRRLAP
jgi:hypothetical protein